MARHTVIMIVLAVLALPFVVTGLAWKLNNPASTDMAYWYHLSDAFHFRSLPRYQLP